MAKVRLDRQVANRQLQQTKLSRYLKLEFALDALSRKCAEIVEATTPALFQKCDVFYGEVRIMEPQEIVDA